MLLGKRVASQLCSLGICLSVFLVAACGSEGSPVEVIPDLPDGREITVSIGDIAPEEAPTETQAEIDSDSDIDSDKGSDQTIAAALTGPASITDLVLVTGQSNALGSLTAFDENLDSPVDRFYAYTENGWQLASLRQVWDLGWHPRTAIDTDPHNNFAFHFGKNVASMRTDRVVGIVLVTAPGEGISHWDSDNYFYNKIRTKALAALNELPQKSQYDGILWHQGETDWVKNGSSDADLAGLDIDDNYYSNKLWKLIDNFRNESWFDHGKPFICGETAQSPINARLMALNRNSDPWTACVEGEGLATYDDVQVHFTAESLRTLGANYAETYLQITR